MLVRTRRRARGSMLLEVVLASAIGGIAIALIVGVQIHVLRNYQRALAHNTGDRAAYNALREIRTIAQLAMRATVLGNTVILTLPAHAPTGQLILPLQPDPANAATITADMATGQLILTHGRQTRVLLRNLVNTTPQGAPYAPFAVQQVAPGVVVLHVRLSVRETHASGTERFLYEETIMLRNAVH